MVSKNKKKFTPAQQTVIDHLSDGWELGVSTSHITSTPRTRHWLQQGKIGAGGKSQNISKATVESLKALGVLQRIRREDGHYDAIYALNAEALAALSATTAVVDS